jgi:hypothetical protein
MLLFFKLDVNTKILSYPRHGLNVQLLGLIASTIRDLGLLDIRHARLVCDDQSFAAILFQPPLPDAAASALHLNRRPQRRLHAWPVKTPRPLPAGLATHTCLARFSSDSGSVRSQQGSSACLWRWWPSRDKIPVAYNGREGVPLSGRCHIPYGESHERGCRPSSSHRILVSSSRMLLARHSIGKRSP